MEVFYFHAHYGFEYEGWTERDEYGFMVAKDFNHVMQAITEYYREDLISIEIQYVGDTGMISIDDKEIAESFRKSYIKTHYEEE